MGPECRAEAEIVDGKWKMACFIVNLSAGTKQRSVNRAAMAGSFALLSILEEGEAINFLTNLARKVEERKYPSTVEGGSIFFGALDHTSFKSITEVFPHSFMAFTRTVIGEACVH